jgi:tRNA-splicing ligase RtcB
MKLKKIDNYRFVIPISFQEGMKIEGLIYSSDKLIAAVERDGTLKQVANVATLPGFVGRSLAMPDAHQGYGFAIGGVAAADLDKGVVSAGGVGFDINCGVRLLASDLELSDVKPRLDRLLDSIFKDVPCGTGKKGITDLSYEDLDRILKSGAYWAVENGYGFPEDLVFIEENGRMKEADPKEISERSRERGKGQLGTLGSGNHFIEIQYVSEIYDKSTAGTFGLREDQVVIMIHSGSRGLGHQVCTDFLEIMLESMPKYSIKVTDRQLACVPVRSAEGERYLCAMSAAANFAFANRQMIGHRVRSAFNDVFGRGDLKLVYDVAHNIAKKEKYNIRGKETDLLVHRKGATRAFPGTSIEVPPAFRGVGQPVLIPGSMGTNSYILVGTEKAMAETYGSTCHGAGRAMSRHAAKKGTDAEKLIRDLGQKGIYVRGASRSGLTEEKPDAYKDVNEVVEVVHNAGISLKVAKTTPIGVVKG